MVGHKSFNYCFLRLGPPPHPNSDGCVELGATAGSCTALKAETTTAVYGARSRLLAAKGDVVLQAGVEVVLHGVLHGGHGILPGRGAGALVRQGGEANPLHRAERTE